MPTSGSSIVTAPARSTPDRLARRAFRIPETTQPAGEKHAYRLFNVSIFLSALRCLLTYIVLPVVSPLLGAATNVGVTVGIPLAVVALVFDVRAIRSFFLADHRWRWPMAGLYVIVMALVAALLIGDIVKIS